MSVSGTTIALALFMLWWILILSLDRRGILEKYNMQAYGPVLMIRTRKGLSFLDEASRFRTFWWSFGTTGIFFMLAGMLVIFGLVIISDFFMLTNMPAPTVVNEPRNWLLIPGVNEFIPAWGWLGLLVTLIVHELAHGILARREGIKVKSMGLLLALIPIGAFAEPDEEELFGSKDGNKPSIISSEARNRILAAGVMSNFIVAAIALALFFGPVLSVFAPTGNNVVITEVLDQFKESGIKEEMVVTAINGVSVRSLDDIFSIKENGDTITVDVLDRGVMREFTLRVVEGALIKDVLDGYPASTAKIEPGSRIIRMNNVVIHDAGDFYDFMEDTKPEETVSVTTVDDSGREETFEVKLIQYPYSEKEEKGFLGVVVYNVPFGMVWEFPAETYLSNLKKLPGSFFGWILLMALPVIPVTQGGFGGFGDWLMQLYTPSIGGIWAFYVANALFWIGWINFYAGLFNCLPAVPLDGGYVFREMANKLTGLFTSNPERQKKITDTLTLGFALFILASIIFMLVGPYLVRYLRLNFG
ncbi:MAG: membrane protein containing Peptidase M50 domain protein [Candidatus Syntrophoarchaeum caldarius]|uniref:Membrane protein containing Peptidase M50 domain protein n=1 Tax=Candidatus Syntropharchaeum caldarium TaxID=1838285 RepID=A0A1F2P9E4_9EURY|nr:MAG: membrane protein containing Peptidase M50 domain protein [Candidatus Syntrophoarchaeum caldarius]